MEKRLYDKIRQKMETKTKTPKPDICCGAFEKMASKFEWLVFDDDGEKIYIMPHIYTDKARLRINNCPSCGFYVRDIQLTEEEFKTLKDEN